MRERAGYQSEQIRNENFLEFRDSGKLKESQRKVYECLRLHGEMTSQQVADELGVPLHHISGRMTELMQIGLVQISRKSKNICNRPVAVWRINTEAKQISLNFIK